MCERKEKEQSQDAERAQSQGRHPLPTPSQQWWTEALPSLCAGASVLSSLQKECDQQIPHDFLLLCSSTNHFSIYPTSGTNPQGTKTVPQTCIKVFSC